MAVATAPERPVAKQVVTRRIEPREYIFRLIGKAAEEYKKREVPGGGRLMLAMQDDIYWPYINGVPLNFDDEVTKEMEQQIDFVPRSIRYVSGAKSIFLDEQEKTGVYRIENGRNRLLDNPANRDRLLFENCELRVPSNDKVLRNYLWCMNQCKNQFPKANDKGRKAKLITAEFEMIDFGYADTKKVEFGMQREKAYQNATTARNEVMIPHAKYLGISFTHEGVDMPKDLAAVKEDYVTFALTKPDVFLNSFNDPKVKLMYQVQTLVDNQQITLGGKTLGQAHFTENGTFIAQLPPDQNPVEFLAEFAMTKAGEEFSNNLRAFSK